VANRFGRNSHIRGWLRRGIYLAVVSQSTFAEPLAADSLLPPKLNERQGDTEELAPATIAPANALKPIVGRLNIPCLHLSVVVLEGDDGKTLRRAIGHVPGTAVPGHRGNAVLAGHRDTFLRNLRNVRKNDRIIFTTAGRRYEYSVRVIRIVEPEETNILAPSGEERLTLITCYPFQYVGSAPRRFVVQASRYLLTSFE